MREGDEANDAMAAAWWRRGGGGLVPAASLFLVLVVAGCRAGGAPVPSRRCCCCLAAATMSLKRKEPDTGFEGHDAAKRPLVQQVIAKAPVVQITTRPAASSSAAADGGGGLGPSLPSSAAIGPSLPPSAIPTAIDASNAAPYPVGYMPRARAASGAPRGAPIVSGASASASAGPAPSPIPARAAPLPATSTGISVLQSIASRSKAPTPEPAVKKHVRTAAGVVWEDPTLSAWNDGTERRTPHSQLAAGSWQLTPSRVHTQTTTVSLSATWVTNVRTRC